MNIPNIEHKSVMDYIESGVAVSGQEPNRRMMWLVLSAVRASGGECSKSVVRQSLVDGHRPATEEEGRYFADNKLALRHLLTCARRDLLAYGLLEASPTAWKTTRLGKVISNEDELHFFTSDEAVDTTETTPWQEGIVEKLSVLSPRGFEVMIARLLSKAGVFQARVTGRSNDGGIDGTGSLVKGHDVPVVFQAKRYTAGNAVSSSQVRDFRGAVQGRAHSGMFFTTSSFTKSAREEAERTQAVGLYLFDGAQLATWIKELGIGVKVETRVVEDVTVDEDWWDGEIGAHMSEA